MAVETALKFLQRVEREDTLRQQLYISSPDTLPKLTEFARGKGFVISEDDLIAALDDYQPRFVNGTVEPLRKYIQRYKRIAHERQTASDSSNQESE